VIAKPNTPTVRPARVDDDGRFLRWLEYAKEALPVSEAETEALEEGPAPDLAEIPAAIVVKRRDGSKPKEGAKRAAPRKGMTSATLPAPRETTKPASSGKKSLSQVSKQAPIQRKPAKSVKVAEESANEETVRKPLDTSRFSNFDDYNDGKTKIAPLKRGAAMDGNKGLQRPKFMDGKLPRSIERGVLHPAPARIVITSILLMLTKLLLLATIIILPIAVFLDAPLVDNKHYVKEALPVAIAFLVVGAAFIVVGNKARCRVCSCHFFFTRRCHKHKAAHRLWFMGAAGSAALHLLMFKWMRCMYCGTAIRLRGSTGVGKPSKDGRDYDSDEGEDE
jgi:hypothetical protein